MRPQAAALKFFHYIAAPAAFAEPSFAEVLAFRRFEVL